MNSFSFPDQNVETVVGNGRMIARSRAGSVDFAYAGPCAHLRLFCDDERVDDRVTRTEVRPRRALFEAAGGIHAEHAAAPRELVYLLRFEVSDDAGDETSPWRIEVQAEAVTAEGDHLITRHGGRTGRVELRGDGIGERDLTAEVESGEKDLPVERGTLTLTLEPGVSVTLVMGDAAAVEAFDEDPAVVFEMWEEEVRARGLRLETPEAELNRAVDFMKAHMHLGYDWGPREEGGGMMVCDVFRWRDVWSRDFGSGFGPGAVVANLYEGVLDTLDYEADRYQAHDPSGLKVSTDTSQGGSAESLGWVMKLVWRVYKHTGDGGWLARMVEAFEPWMDEWVRRDADEDGLVVDVTEWMDHSRFLRLTEGQRTLYSNVLYYAALRRFSHICGALDRNEDAERYRRLATRTRQSIHDAFWNEAGYFNNASAWGVADTALMLADNAIAITERVASRNERFRTLETIRERNWRPFGSVTCDLPMKYVGAGNDHNGTVWPWWMAHEAKARFQNFDAEGALHVVRQIIATLARPTYPGLCEEYLQPDDGHQDDVAGHAFITGAGATLDALLYGLVGFSHQEPGDRTIRLAPVVPRHWDAWRAEVELFEGRIAFEQTPDGYRVELDGTRVETLEVRVPPREAVAMVTVDGKEAQPERVEEGASQILRFLLTPGAQHAVEVEFAPTRVWPVHDFARPEALPAPLTPKRVALMDEPRLFADILQGFVVNAVSYFGRLSHVAAREIGSLSADDMLVVVGNEMPLRTKRGRDVREMIGGFLDEGGSMLLLGPRFARIHLTEHFHEPSQMGGRAGMFWWKVWREGRWEDINPYTEKVVTAPAQRGTVYWGEGPLFAAWEHALGLFGFETDARGVFDVHGNAVDADQPVEVVYTDWTVAKPWTFHPLAFTERTEQLVTGPRTERYPCAALLVNETTGARIGVVSPALCSRADLLHRILGHLASAG